MTATLYEWTTGDPLEHVFLAQFLFSGLLKCGECGASLIIATRGGTHRHKKYACSRRFNNRGCENDLFQ
jgi:hypothetical protein